MDIQRITSRCAFGPRPARERISRDDCAEAVEQRPGQRLLDRRQRHPGVAVTEETVAVEVGTRAVGPGPGLDRAPTSVEIRLRRGGRNPVFEAVLRERRLGVVGDEEQSGHSAVP
jgi:hypothetical protein